MVDPGQGMDHRSSWSLTHVNIRIKVIIIVILKLDSRVDPEQIPGHESRELIWVDTSQYMDKNNCYLCFKTQLKSQPG